MTNERMKWILQVLAMIIVLVTLFAACGKERHLKDLQQYISQLKQQNPKEKAENNKLLTPVKPVQYTAASLRAPFGETATIVTHGTTKEIEGNPLLGYSLPMLRFVGTVVQDNSILAYILAPDNKVYQVRVGDEVDDQHGTVISIQPNRLQIMDRTSAGQSITTLELKEKD